MTVDELEQLRDLLTRLLVTANLPPNKPGDDQWRAWAAGVRRFVNRRIGQMKWREERRWAA